ncbi:hypothetical protein O181_068099 [Austropuccinia psidii MF-1]|uniref:Uncharacterized protein n=1 Tax=Austropuccinia psidii MF-1 TaxID=1389203 RepID=A0A9Q3I782_9BASI|nr:hypothetical protein [Austropuccinia psidii MF-1]
MYIQPKWGDFKSKIITPSLRPFGSVMSLTTIPPSLQAPTAPIVVSPPQPFIPSIPQMAATSSSDISLKPALRSSLLSCIQLGLLSKPLFLSPASTVNNPSLSVKPNFSFPTKSQDAQAPKRSLMLLWKVISRDLSF